MSELSVVVGIDVAKDHVDVAFLSVSEAPARLDNDSDGHTALSTKLTALGVRLVAQPVHPASAME